MREYKFRGKRKDTGDWIYGDIMTGTLPSITWWKPIGEQSYEIDCADVDPKSVGQYVGLKDIKGSEIYEGDIIRIEDHPFEGPMKINGNYEVGYNERMELCCGSLLLHRERPYAVVIGNVYDNPELLEAAE